MATIAAARVAAQLARRDFVILDELGCLPCRIPPPRGVTRARLGLARSLPRYSDCSQTTPVTKQGSQWAKRDSVSAVPNFRRSSSLHSLRDVWLANFSFI